MFKQPPVVPQRISSLAAASRRIPVPPQRPARESSNPPAPAGIYSCPPEAEAAADSGSRTPDSLSESCPTGDFSTDLPQPQPLSKWPAVNLVPNGQNQVSLPSGTLLPDAIAAAARSGSNYPPATGKRSRRPGKIRAIVTATDVQLVQTEPEPQLVASGKYETSADVRNYSTTDANETGDENSSLPTAKENVPLTAATVKPRVSPTRHSDSALRLSTQTQHSDSAQICALRHTGVQTIPTQQLTCSTQTEHSDSAHLGVQTFPSHHDAPGASELQYLPFRPSDAPVVPSVSSVHSGSPAGSEYMHRMLDRVAGSGYSVSDTGGDLANVSSAASSQSQFYGSQVSVESSVESPQQQGVHIHHHHHHRYYYGPRITHVHNYHNCTINQGRNMDSWETPREDSENEV